jgi:hypothetical protein
LDQIGNALVQTGVDAGQLASPTRAIGVIMKLEHFGLALLVVAVWGVNFVVIKVGLHQVPPFLMVGLCIVQTCHGGT